MDKPLSREEFAEGCAAFFIFAERLGVSRETMRQVLELIIPPSINREWQPEDVSAILAESRKD